MSLPEHRLAASGPGPIAHGPLLAALFALALLAGSAAHSLTAALAACVVAALSWRVGPALAGCAAIAGLAVVFMGAPPIAAPGTYSFLAACAALLLVATLGPSFYLRRLGRSEAVAAPASSAPETLPLGSLKLRGSGESIRSPGMDPLAPPGSYDPAAEAHRELETLRRFLRDARDAVGVDDLIFWRKDRATDVLIPAASARDDGIIDPDIVQDEHIGSIVTWAVEARIITANDEEEDYLFIAAPVGKASTTSGALAIIARDRAVCPKERIKPWLGRYASQLASLLELLDDARAAARYRRRATALTEASEGIHKARNDLAALGQAICEGAVRVTAASRAAMVIWDAKRSSGHVQCVTEGHPVPAGFAISADSLVGKVCSELKRYANPSALDAGAQVTFYGSGEERRNVGSIAIIHLEGSNGATGAVVVEGDAADQITIVEVETLQLLATEAASAFAATHAFQEMDKRARSDTLTGLASRFAFEERLGQLLAESDRYGTPTSLILLDIDFFKKVNDRFGHPAGDEVLKKLADTVRDGRRTPDLCARYGGEELAILLPQTGLDGANDVANRLRVKVEQQRAEFGGKIIPITASFGVACFPENVRGQEALLLAADQALYEAKRSGRNCVKLARPSIRSKAG